MARDKNKSMKFDVSKVNVVNVDNVVNVVDVKNADINVDNVIISRVISRKRFNLHQLF